MTSILATLEANLLSIVGKKNLLKLQFFLGYLLEL